MSRIKMLFRYLRREKVLFDRGWYRNMHGDLVHPHLLAVVPSADLLYMSDDEFAKL